MTLAFASITALLGSIALGGCPGSLDDPNKFLDGGSTSSGGCLDIETEMFAVEGDQDKVGCAGMNCHSPEQPEIDLVSPGVKDRLVGASINEACAPTAVVADPSDPEGSLLYQKVAGGTPPCGSPMPFVGAKLSESEVECVKEYISSLSSGTPGAGGNGTGGRGTGGRATGGNGSGGEGGTAGGGGN